MDLEEREMKLFMLRVFKIVYQALKVKLPSTLQKEIEKFSSAETGFFFNDIISKAILVLTSATFENLTFGYKEFPSLGSRRFFQIHKRICLRHDPCKFLKFTIGFGMQAAYNRDDESFQKVWRAVENFFMKAREDELLTSSTWLRLERVASRFVEEDYMKCLRIPDFDPSKPLNLENEKSFVLRVMQHYFNLNAKELPDLFYEEIRKLDEQDYQLTENVRKAIFYVQESQQSKAQMMEELCKKDWFRFSSYGFTAKNYFDLCICFTRKALEDYFHNDKPLSPYQVFKTLVKALQGFSDRGLPVPWEELEHTASTIVQETERNQNSKIETEAEIRMFQEEVVSMSPSTESLCLCNMCLFMKEENPIPEEDCFDILNMYP